MKWAESKRMEFISRILSERGHINRKDIIAEFGISTPQASNDLRTYKDLYPESTTYNFSAKRYESAAIARAEGRG